MRIVIVMVLGKPAVLVDRTCGTGRTHSMVVVELVVLVEHVVLVLVKPAVLVELVVAF